MAGDVTKIVTSGNPVRPSAQLHNRTVRAVKAVEQSAKILSARTPAIHVPEGLIFIQNASGADRKRFEILGIKDILYGPTDNKTEFQNNPALIGVTPTSSHKGKFVICAEPIANNAVGKAWIFGVCPVQIDMQNDGDPCADVDAGDATQLKSAARGAVQILWSDSGTGTVWCLVRFGAFASNGIFRVNLSETSGAAGSSTTAPSWEYTVTDDDGNTLATNASPARGRDYNGKRNAASLGYGHYDDSGNFILDEAWEAPGTVPCT